MSLTLDVFYFRMNNKVELSRMCDSYWDLLPPEIQAYILALKAGQERIDKEREKKLMIRLRWEIKTYARLKEKWRVGHVKCVPHKTPCWACGRHHVKVYGQYVNHVHNVNKTYFFATGLKHASQMVDIIKANYF